MNTQLSLAIIAGLGGMLGWGLADFFAKKTIDEIGDLTSLFWGQALGLVPLLSILLLFPGAPSMHLVDAFYLLLFGAVSGASYLMLYHGFGKGQVSLLSPIFASYGGFVVLISFLFFHENITVTQFEILGIVLASIHLGGMRSEFKGIRSVAGFSWVFPAMIVFASWLAVWNQFVSGKYWVIYLLLMRFASAATIWAWARFKKSSLKIPDKKLWLYVALIGVCDVGAYASVTYGFSETSKASIVAMLSGAFSVPTILLAHFFLKERLSKVQMTGIATIITGIILMAMVKTL